MRHSTQTAIRCAAAVLALVLLLPGVAWAQGQTPAISAVSVGTRIRIQAPASIQGRVEGTVMTMDETSLLISTNDHRPLTVRRQDITSLEVSAGRQRSVIQGAAIGAIAGLLILQTSVRDNCANNDSACYTDRSRAAADGLLGGAIWGAGIGALIKRDRWMTVPTESVRVSVAPSRGRGVRLSLSDAW